MIVNEEYDNLKEHLKNIPGFTNKDEILEAKALIDQAIYDLHIKRNENIKTRELIKKQLNFLDYQSNIDEVKLYS
jgi:hypothetical protein